MQAGRAAQRLAGAVQTRHQRFGTRKQEIVAVRIVQIAGQPGIGAPGDGGLGQAPTQTEGAIAGAAVIAKPQPREQTAPPRRQRQRQFQSAGAGGAGDGKGFADAANGAAALGQRQAGHGGLRISAFML